MDKPTKANGNTTIRMATENTNTMMDQFMKVIGLMAVLTDMASWLNLMALDMKDPGRQTSNMDTARKASRTDLIMKDNTITERDKV